MTRIMRDSTTAADIPLQVGLEGLDLVAGYANGLYAWKPADWALFPGRISHVVIDVTGADPAGCGVLDVETGDATVAQAPGWVKTRHRIHPGSYCVIYCSRSALTPLFNAMAAAGLAVAKDFHLWIATLDGTRSVADMTGVVAVQYAGQVQTGSHYDESAVYDDRWHASQPAPAPAPAPQLDGEVVWYAGGQLHARGVISADNGGSWR